jgi:seryl-tRNA synthetase
LTYDFELFSTAQDRWLEISSVSTLKLQANRLKLRFKDKDGKPTSAYLKRKFIGFAKSVSWNFENYQTAEGIVIPEVLRPYCGFDIIDYTFLLTTNSQSSFLK